MSDDLKSLAWQRKLTEPIPMKPKPIRVTPRLLWHVLPVVWRINRWSRGQRKLGRRPLFDLVRNTFPIIPDKGVPMGGLGGGTITRGCRGSFNRWGIKPGDYTYQNVPADQFSLWVSRDGHAPQAVVLNPDRPEEDVLQGWAWDLSEEKITYRALFPRAWHDYLDPLPGLSLSCKQISPVIPHNYQESSYPVCTFVWSIENNGKGDIDLSLMFTFQNGMGVQNDLAGGHSNHPLQVQTPECEVVGLKLRHRHRHSIPLAEGQKLADQSQYEDQLTFGMGALAKTGVEVTTHTCFDTHSDGGELWEDFSQDGCLANQVDPTPSSKGSAIGGAVCARVHVPAGERREIVFALAWDMPIARFPDGTGWYRRYTKFLGRDGKAVPKLLTEALTKYPAWEIDIDDWQRPIMTNEALPLWYRQMLFNETYFLVDGGTLWTAGREDSGLDEADPLEEPEMGHFAYIESHEYRMYNTYDVHFSASFALAMLWPKLELSLQCDFAKALLVEDDEVFTFFFLGKKGPRKVAGVIPHDLGSPLENPWLKINAYNAQDVSRWKDLNPKFVLQIARDYFLTKDNAFLESVWPAVKQAIATMNKFDMDGDGMIENEGFPDQTYDAWSVKGVSAYTGGLWLACLQAGAALAEVMGEDQIAGEYLGQFSRALKVYEDKLWNGEYYNYEASSSKHADSIMADQLAGHWFSMACGLGGILPQAHVRSALNKIFALNVMGVKDGRMGAINGMRPDGRLDKTALQSQEIWTGTTFTLAAAMLQAGLDEEAFKTIRGIYQVIYEDYGLWFQTPEAVSKQCNVRAISYMRPLAIWALQWELEGYPEKLGGRNNERGFEN
jgi:non-lysosomal glucosylceramidase